jgi:hypothetical protein
MARSTSSELRDTVVAELAGRLDMTQGVVHQSRFARSSERTPRRAAELPRVFERASTLTDDAQYLLPTS